MIDTFSPGTLVLARGREWTVLPESRPNTLRLRPLGGADDDATLIYLPLEKEPIRSAQFPPPDPERSGNQESGLLLRDALRLRLRSGSGPFRSVGNLGFEPRAYQIVPLLMALKLDTVRLLIADDVGVGKTIEAGLIAREFLDRGMIDRMVVICPPHLCDQWEEELREKFHLRATVVQARTASRLERGLPAGRSLFEEYPVTVVSLDYIKSEKRRDEFARSCPEFVIVEEAHSCVRGSVGVRHQRYLLLKELAKDPERHMVFLTATPHSGNDEAFFNLLGLLDPAFLSLGEVEGKERERLREKLASHFVQRRRPDIAEWRDAHFFPDRESRETTYKLSGEMESFFSDILSYARELVVNTSLSGKPGNRLNWWAALALLRCACSSPAAAAMALSTRLGLEDRLNSLDVENTDIERMGMATVMDGDEADDLLSSDDRVPGAELSEESLRPDSPLGPLINRAKMLQGEEKDPKLAGLIPEVKRLLKEGFNPVIFCRYIATADYLRTHLERSFGNIAVIDAVTGLLPPEEREERINAFGVNESERTKGKKSRILVATDCLSEGINLQKFFDAVIHYDLSWNPTRHEQREGRMDRFGQPQEKVRVILYYGENNPVDGTVLKVILRKAETIRKELGVSLPFPTDSNRVLQAVMESVFFRQKEPEKMVPGKLNLTFDPGEEDELLTMKELESAWQSARESASGKSRTIFAQNRLKPDDVIPEWNRSLEILGGDEDVFRYVKLAAQRLGAPLEDRPDGLFWNPDYLPSALRDSLRDHGVFGRQKVVFSPNKQGLFLHRSHPIVTTLADYISEMALSEKVDGLVSRSGAIFTKSVLKKTVLLLVRFRTQIVVMKKNRFKTILAEELQVVDVAGGESPDLFLSTNGISLMKEPASRNMEPEQRKRLVLQVVESLSELSVPLERLARERADTLKEDHQRVLSASAATGGRVEVIPNLPPDVIGITVLMPDRMPEVRA